jgi:Flp pilus assembly protein TadD
VLGFSGLVEPRAAWPLAAAAAHEALRRDPQVAEAHTALAFVALFQDWDWAAAEASLARALELQPDEPAPHHWRALFLLLRGRLDEAERELQVAEECDPLSVALHTTRGFWAALRCDYAAEAEAHRRALELAPHQFLGHWGLGLAELHLGRPQRAVAEHRQALELAQGSAFVKGVLARSLALAGEQTEARALLEDLEQGSAAAAAAYQRALARLALGERAAALRCLAGAAEVRNPWLVLLGVDPMLDELRGDAGFEQLRERVCPGVGARAVKAAKPARPRKPAPSKPKPKPRTRAKKL